MNPPVVNPPPGCLFSPPRRVVLNPALKVAPPAKTAGGLKSQNTPPGKKPGCFPPQKGGETAEKNTTPLRGGNPQTLCPQKGGEKFFNTPPVCRRLRVAPPGWCPTKRGASPPKKVWENPKKGFQTVWKSLAVGPNRPPKWFAPPSGPKKVHPRYPKKGQMPCTPRVRKIYSASPTLN